MSLSRAVARPMLASIFISGGLDAMRNPESKVPSAQPVTDQLRTWVPSLPEDTATLVKVNGMVQFGAGVLLALGKVRRLAALALIGSVIPTTYAGHRYWEESDEKTRAQQRAHFLKNVGLLGGLILAMVDTEGAPSIGWRARRGAHRVSHAVAVGRSSTGSGAHNVSVKAAGAGRRAARNATKASLRSQRAVANAATSGLALAGPYARHANESARHAAKAALASAEGGAHLASSKAGASGRKARRQVSRAAGRANKARLRGGHRANRVLVDAATSGVARAAPYVLHAGESVQGVAKALLEGAEPALTALREGVEPLLEAGMERAEELRTKATDHRDH